MPESWPRGWRARRRKLERERPKPYERSRMDRSWASPPALHVWSALRYSPGPQSARELARRMLWPTLQVDAMLARLRAAGFAKYDRRQKVWCWAGDPLATLALYRGEKP